MVTDATSIRLALAWCLPEIEIGPERAHPGDVVLVSGTLGDHGMAIMSVREGLEFESLIQSDSAALAGLVREMLAVCPDIHVLRDPTRGGPAASLNEIAAQSGVGIELDETRIPVDPVVGSACEILGLDPMHVANEGKLIAIVPPESADSLLAHDAAKPPRKTGRDHWQSDRVTSPSSRRQDGHRRFPRDHHANR